MSTSSHEQSISLRLTQADRESIVRRALEFAFDKKRKELATEENAIGRAAYAFLFPEKVRKIANTLPEGWLREDECLRLAFRGMQSTINVKPGLRVPSKQYSCNRLGQISDDALSDRFLALEASKDNLEKAMSETRANLIAMLSRFNTLNTLRIGWPDGAKFYDHLKPKDGSGVPAVQIAKINEMLGLPIQAPAQ